MDGEKNKSTYTSAEELRELLIAIHESNSGNRKQMSLADFLVDHFGVQKTHKGRITGLLKISNLAERVLLEVQGLSLQDRYSERIQHDVVGIRDRLFALGTNASIANVVQNIPLDVVNSLTYVEMILSQSVSYPDMDDVAEELASDLAEMIEKVVSSDLPSALKESISKKLEDLAISIRRYRVWGAEAIENELFSLAGEVVVNSVVDDDVRQDAATKEIFARLGRVFDFIGKARKASDDSSRLVEFGKKMVEYLPEL